MSRAVVNPPICKEKRNPNKRIGVQKGIENVTCPSASLKTTLYLFSNFFQAERPFLFLSEKKKRNLFLNHV